MEDLELFYLRDLAFEHMPKEKKSLIESNQKLVPIVTKSSDNHYTSAAASMLMSQGHFKAVEIAAARLLFLVSSPLSSEDDDLERDVKELRDERRGQIVHAAFDLAKIAEISLPAWLTNKHQPDSQSLQEEVDSLRAEVERLAAENAALGQAGSDTSKELSFTYITDNLRLVAATQQEFYDDDFDINVKHTYPTRDGITDWLRDEHSVVSAETRRAIERTATPFDRNPANKK